MGLNTISGNFTVWILINLLFCSTVFVISATTGSILLLKEIEKRNWDLPPSRERPPNNCCRNIISILPRLALSSWWIREKPILNHQPRSGYANTWMVDGNYFMASWSYPNSSGIFSTISLPVTATDGSGKKKVAWCPRRNWVEGFFREWWIVNGQ